MPGMSGLEMIATALDDAQINRDLQYIVVTGHGSTEENIDAIQQGAVDFMQKPFDFMRLVHAVDRAQELVNQNRSRRYFEELLPPDIIAKTSDLSQLCNWVDGAYEGVMNFLLSDSEYDDPELGKHIHNIGECAALMADKLGWSEARQQKLLLAAPLHDIGKIGTPENILFKPGELDAAEWSMIKQHPEMGYRILSNSPQPVMQIAANIALQHHERWDGSGYPLGLQGDAIAIEARIVSLIDIYDALRTEKPYKPALSHAESVDIILNGDGRTSPGHFDPEILAIFRKYSDQFSAIFTSHQ